MVVDEPQPRKFRSAPDVHSRAFGQELVLLDLARGEYFSLDELGARIWNETLAGRSLSAVVDLLVRDYDVHPDQLRADVLGLLNELVARGLLVLDVVEHCC